ncbi:unnamed protein product [Caenorhabditis auriculariae]|uniref:PAN-3 domain-containing protein n=1 Tax=Caenorhabditis auriculariae TaxID=2777116 RepID=A0A8S1HF98_9PELO|nr:unnamed protein product [Caenorhabditis auriculariae]
MVFPFSMKPVLLSVALLLFKLQEAIPSPYFVVILSYDPSLQPGQNDSGIEDCRVKCDAAPNCFVSFVFERLRDSVGMNQVITATTLKAISTQNFVQGTRQTQK